MKKIVGNTVSLSRVGDKNSLLSDFSNFDKARGAVIPGRFPAPACRPELTIDTRFLDHDFVLYDLSRSLRSRRLPFLTGIDRIDIAFANSLHERLGDRCRFVASTTLGPALLAPEIGAGVLATITARIGTGGPLPQPAVSRRALLRLLAEGVARWRAFKPPAGAAYVNASHSGLPVEDGVFAGRLGALSRVIYLHDLIPLDYPEYQTPRTRDRFLRFLGRMIGPQSHIVANSRDTAERVAGHAGALGRRLAGISVATPRLAPSRRTSDSPVREKVRAALSDPRPYFVMIGTIEPRKNHLLLLNLWREFASQPDAPRLIIIGRRGWENEMVIDMLDRCEALRGEMTEFGDLGDEEVYQLLCGARALLTPSFAEGLGLPVMEAAYAGVPAIMSDIPALREVAGSLSTFLDPLDGAAWREAILAHV